MRLSLRAAPPGVSCCACRPRAVSSAVVWSLVYLANGLILGVGFANHSTAACGAAFVATAIALVIHLVRASLTRQLHPLRLIVGFNVVVLAAASLSRERLSTQALSSIVVGIPLLSYYGFWGAALVLAPPRADEALKPPKELRECHPFNQLTVGVVLLVEFVQFNFLSFNPALGAWQEVHSLTESYRSVFLEVSEVQFDELLWVYCALALGWIIFAILVILILARWSDHTVLARLPTGGPDFSGLIGEEREGPMPLHGPPVWRVMIFIGYWGRSAIHLHRQRLVRWKTAAWHVAWGTRNLSPAPLALLGMVALVFMSGFFVFGTALATFMLMAAIALCCLAGLALCGAFAFITLFHFPIVMNIFASLHCTYNSAGEAGTMQRMPSQACWHGRHWHFVLVAVPILLVIYPLMIYFERKRLSGAEVSHHVHFTARILIGKLALSAASTLLVRESPSIYLLFCVGMLTFFLHVNNQREEDDQPASCNVRSVRLSRSMLITCALWTCCVTLGSQVLEVPEYALLSALGGLWLLTCMFFGALIVFPQHEPQYLSSDAHLSASVPLPRSSKGKETSTPQHKGTGSGGPPAQTPSVRDTPPSPRGMYATHISSGDRAAIRKEAGGSVTSLPVAAASRGMGGRGLQNASLLRTPAHASKAICFGSPEVVGSSTRTVRLPSALAARSRVTFFGYDDGFESVSNFDSEEADRSADACDLLPIVMATQRSSGFGQQLLNVSGGGVLSPIKRSRKDDELRPLDTIVSFNGVTGLGAAEIAERLEADSGPIELVVQRAQLRGGGTKRGPPISSLGDMHVRNLTQCLLLYPQDAQLQRGGFEHIKRQMLSCTDDKRAEVLAEIQHCAVLPVIVNAMEVHSRHAAVQTSSASLLRCLASTGGALRANVVAAGVLPAVCSALRVHINNAEVVAAMCDLCAEVSAIRNSPPGTRRAMCEALAATGALKMILRVLRKHVTHEGVVTAGCQVLLAFQEEFDGSSPPLPLLAVLKSMDALMALRDAQRRFAHNNTIQFGTTWAVHVGERAAGGRGRRENEPSRAPLKDAWRSSQYTSPVLRTPPPPPPPPLELQPPPPAYPPPNESPTVGLRLPRA